jgi:transcriptional regulator with XRE-family HTH domain
MNQYNSIGEKIAALRRGHDMTLKNVGAKTGLSFSFISDIEHGRVDPSLKTLRKLASLYHMTVSDLLRNVE